MNNITFYKIHIKVHLIDFAQKHCLPLVAILALAIYYLNPKKINAIRFLMKSHRYHPFSLTEKLVKKNLSNIQNNAIALFDGEDSAGEEIQKKRGIILKNPIINDAGYCIEKGVFLIKFTGTLQYYIKYIDVPELQKYFYIVLEPSWAGYCLSEILWWTGLRYPVIIQATEQRDYEFITNLASNLIPTSFGSSDWVNHDTFKPIIPSPEKIYDVIYVSNHNTIKRNHIFLKVISKINDPTFKAALVCSGWGDYRKYNLELIERLKLKDRVDLIEKQNQNELNVILNKSKVNILLSLKEGSNRSLFEGFFAGTPGIVLENNIGTNKSYFTKESGSVIKEKALLKTLIWYKDNWQKLSANKWATDNISIFKTKDKLDQHLKELSEKQNLQWSAGIALKVNSPEATIYPANNSSHLIDAKNIIDYFRLDNINQTEISSLKYMQKLIGQTHKIS